jgi:hypothetical protein
MSEPLDVERELAALRERVRGMDAPNPSAQLTPLQKALSGVNTNWHISARVPPPHPSAPRGWYLVYFVKRVVRRAMFEVLNTLVEQQNAFNSNVARAITELTRENSELRARVEELERRANRK